jgi:hypothetical protein
MMEKAFKSSLLLTPEQVVTFRPRGYQLEMLDASMKQNIIVAVCPITNYHPFDGHADHRAADGYR